MDDETRQTLENRVNTLEARLATLERWMKGHTHRLWYHNDQEPIESDIDCDAPEPPQPPEPSEPAP